jgi:ATP-binding cassette, subfamily B, multidrug efflux pump
MLKLFRFLKPYALSIAAILALTFVGVMADLSLPNLMADIINKGVMNGDTAYIVKIGLRMMLYTGVSLLSAIIGSFFSSRAATFFGRDVRKSIFSTVEGFSLAEFDRMGTATLITRTTNDVTQVQNVMVMMLRLLIYAPMMAIGAIIMAMNEDRQLAVVLAVSVPVLGICVGLLAGIAMPWFKKIQKKVDKLNLVLREGLTGIRVIRAFNRGAREEARFDEANGEITGTYITVNRIMAFAMPVVMMIMNVTALSILWFGVKRIDTGGMELGSLSAFIQYAMQVMFSSMMMAMMFIMVPRASAAAERINEVLKVKPTILDPEVPAKASGQCGDVEFRNVSFSYHGAEQPALRGVSFHARCGEVTAIIGSTGSGKSTLVKLIPRFYDVSDGQVLVDGIDVRQMRQEDLRKMIGYVPQKAVLFSGTIAENLRFGAPDADEAALKDAAGVAQAAGFVEDFEGKYEHHIAQGGTDVSGGQKQRLSIARALARKPEIYIFDDSFSALDFKTDAKLRAALKGRIQGATVLLIAQRVGTVMDADRIIVLDEGRVVGMGTHRELLKSCPVYHEIAQSQLSEEEIA